MSLNLAALVDALAAEGITIAPATLIAIETRYNAAVPAALPDPSWCDCNYEPIRGIKAGRHLPSCRYGVVLDYLDIHDPRAGL